MVLHDIADDAEFVKVSTSSFCAEGLFEGDLNAVNVVAVPGGSEEFVTESENEEVLHHLLSEVVVNTEDLFFLPVGFKGSLKLARAAQVLSEWFLDL